MNFNRVLSDLSVISTETISHQNTLFFFNLSETFNALLKKNISLKVLKETKIEKWTKDVTGVSVDLNWQPVDVINAHMVPPMLDANHPLFHPLFRNYLNSDESVKLTHALDKKIISGTVDRAKGKVGGDFSKVAIPIHLYRGLFAKNVLTGDEIAAIYLHELGHAFTYFECLSDTMTRNYAIAAAVAEFARANDVTDKVTVLREIDQKLGTEIPDKESLAKKSDEVARTVIVLESVRKNKSELGTSLYDTRTWEALSDQFASRMGASKSLASALDKIYRGSHSSAYWSTPLFCLVEILKVTAVIAVSAFLALKGAIFLLIQIGLMLLQDPHTDTYDRPTERIMRIKEDLISRLKDRDLNPVEEKRILEDAKFIQERLSHMKDRDTFWQKVHQIINPFTGSQVNKMREYKDLEALANNNFYLTAAQLRHS